MKRISITLFVISLIMIWSCSKNQSEEIQGRWRWVQSTGGFGGVLLTPANTGKNKLLEITENELRYYENDTLKSTMGYTMEYGTSIRGYKTLMLQHDDGFIQSFDLGKSTLVIYDEAIDGFTSEYNKE